MADVDMDFEANSTTDEQAVTAELEAEYNALLGNAFGSAAMGTSTERGADEASAKPRYAPPRSFPRAGASRQP